MGRYRPPTEASSNYITPEGASALRDELDYLWREKRPEVTRTVAQAAAQGDRSENAEYIYGKKQLREIDRRIRYLRKRLDAIRVVDEAPTDKTKIFFGAWFEIEHDSGERQTFRLVGPDEFDHRTEYLSMDSPLGRAVRGKALTEKITVPAPGGEVRYTIVGVRYENPAKKSPA